MAQKRSAQLAKRAVQLADERLRDACQVTELLLRENARQRVDLAGRMARVKQLEQLLHAASNDRHIKREHHQTARDIAVRLRKGVRGGSIPAFVFLLDRTGRVIAREGAEVERFGDSLAATPVIRDALLGYLRDDVWIIGNVLYRVAVAPVIQHEVAEGYAGAIAIGHAVDKPLAVELARRLRLDVGFFGSRGPFVISKPNPAVEQYVAAGLATLSDDRAAHCSARPAVVADGDNRFIVLMARLPGQAGTTGAAYAVWAAAPTRAELARAKPE